MSRIPLDFDDAPIAPALTTTEPARMAADLMTLRDPVIEVLPAAPEPPASEEERVARAALQHLEQAKAFQVIDPASYEQAGRMIDQLKTKKKDVQGWFAPMVDAAHAAWKALTSKRASVTDPLDEAITVLSSRYATFARDERERAEAERRRQEKAAQEREQARLRAEAEEAARLAAETAKAAETAPTREEAALLAEQAEQLTQQAEQTRVEAAAVQPPVLPVQSRIDHVKGPAVAQNWQHEVTDFAALITAVAAGTVSSQALVPNDTYLRQRAKADKGTAAIPGVRFFDAGSVRASRSRR